MRTCDGWNVPRTVNLRRCSGKPLVSRTTTRRLEVDPPSAEIAPRDGAAPRAEIHLFGVRRRQKDAFAVRKSSDEQA
jgi:hypothetical protein